MMRALRSSVSRDAVAGAAEFLASSLCSYGSRNLETGVAKLVLMGVEAMDLYGL